MIVNRNEVRAVAICTILSGMYVLVLRFVAARTSTSGIFTPQTPLEPMLLASSVALILLRLIVVFVVPVVLVNTLLAVVLRRFR